MGFNDTWHDADPDAVGGEKTEPPEAGLYTIALMDGSAFTSKRGDDWMRVSYEDVATRHGWDVLFGFGSQAAANMAKNQARELGVDLSQATSLEALEAQLRQLAGNYYDVEVVQNGEYRNTYVRGRAGGGMDTPADTSGLAQQQPVAAGAPGSDMPF